MPTSYDDYGGDGGGPQYRFALPTITPMVKRLLIINAVVFAVQFVAFMASDPVATFLDRAFALSPGVWERFFPFVPVWQLGTYAFMHSTTTLMHLAWNMLLLFFFGTMLEGIIGSRRFLVTYLAAAVVGAALHLVTEFIGGTRHPAVGASGAVLGILIAAAVLRPNTQVILIIVPVKLKWVAIGVVALDVFAVLLNLKKGSSDYVAHFVHLGGAAFGFLAAKRGWIWTDPVERVQARRVRARKVRAEDDDKKMDELLARIHRDGLGSLSKREKDFLKRMSSRQK